MNPLLEEILSSPTSLHDEQASFNLALYFILDVDDKFYHYEASSDVKFILQLSEFYINNLAAIDVYGANMFSKRPIHLLRYRQSFNQDIKSTLIFYSNGAICIDQLDNETVVHVWVTKDLVELHKLPKPDELKAV